MLRLPKTDEAIQCVMQPHSRNEWSREIGTHLPIDSNDRAGVGPAGKASKCCLSQLDRPTRIGSIAGDEGRLAECVHPLGQIMEVLAVPIPLQTFVKWFTGIALRQRFADP